MKRKGKSRSVDVSRTFFTFSKNPFVIEIPVGQPCRTEGRVGVPTPLYGNKITVSVQQEFDVKCEVYGVYKEYLDLVLHSVTELTK